MNTKPVFIIVINGPDHSVMGYWRRFDTGSIREFDSEQEAQQVIANWAIDGFVRQQPSTPSTP